MENLDDVNVVFVGSKPDMTYVTAVVTQFTKKGYSEVIIKARGKMIGKTVEISLMVVGTFLLDTFVKDVKIGSEDYTNKEGKPIKVSMIEITIGKK